MTTEYQRSDDGEFVVEFLETTEQTVETYGHLPFRICRVLVGGREIRNDGTDTTMVTVKIVDGLEVTRGTDSAEATVLDCEGDVTLTIDGVETTKTLTDGSVSFDITTEKPAGSTIEIEAESLADHPAEGDRAEIEVIQA